MNDSEQRIMDAINEVADQVRIQNGRVHSLEKNQQIVTAWMRIADAKFQKIEPITEGVAELVGFTRTTARIAKWVRNICGAVAAVVGLLMAVQGWLL